MPENKSKFYLTTPIYYVNARPHIGHAYTTIVADVIARRHRLLGDDTYFLTGTDEHGQKIERSAAAAGIPPQQFADQVSASFETLWTRMGITHDQFIRTTSDKHKRGVQKLFTTLQQNNAIYLDSYTGQYSIGEEMFIDGPPGTIGPDGKPTETVTEENYFFKLSEYQRRLIDLIEPGPNGEPAKLAIQPEVRRNEVLSFLRGNVSAATQSSGAPSVAGPHPGMGGNVEPSPAPVALALSSAGTPYVPGALKDLSISRSSFKWGIPVPGDTKTEQNHVIYVWLDALANYMTAVGYGSEDPADIAQFEKYWPADLHLVGKEIIRFHCVYWPAFLMAANLQLPKAITAHGWLLFEDSKMSKSRGNIVRTETILDAFGTLKPKPIDLPGPVLSDMYWKHEQDLFASDILRYFLLREIPFGQDGSFSFDALWSRYNSDLANGYGNLVSRTLTMIEKNCEGSVPTPTTWADSPVFLKDPDNRSDQQFSVTNHQLAQASFAVQKFYDDAFERYRFALPLDAELAKASKAGVTDAAMYLVGQADGFITAKAPWKLAKAVSPESTTELRDVLYASAATIRIITALLYPVMPYATAQVWRQLGLGDIEEAAQKGELENLEWGGLKPGTKLGTLAPIFPRAPKELIQLMTDMENPEPTPSKFVGERTTDTAPVQDDPTHPAAPPRTSALTEESPGTQVAGSATTTTERPETPPHQEAAASGPFANAAAQSDIPDTPQIAIDDFVKIDLRVAQIVVAERIPKADKLLRLEVDLGYEKRQILSGIAEWYTPEELLGRRIVIIANLAPRKMRGLESHGMLLAASHGENGKPVLATFGDSEDIALGSRLR
jgi:methionyl-tRNA synthetase